MIDLNPVIQRIDSLLEDGADHSIAYAALEARLAIERLCYDRLMQVYEYISYDQLRGWNPSSVVRQLMEEVDPFVASTCTFLLSTKPTEEGVEQEDSDFVEIGTQIGFDHRTLTELWNALSNLALHVSLPKDKQDALKPFRDSAKVREKVLEVRDELVRLSKGTMTISSPGEAVSFTCECGSKNKRKIDLLIDGTQIFCVNPKCRMVWKAHKNDGKIAFERLSIDFECKKCQYRNIISPHEIIKLKHNQTLRIVCLSCGAEHLGQWVIGIKLAE